MYRVTKPRGHNVNVTIENTDTKSSVIIGRLSMDILNILEKAGHKMENYTDEVNIEVPAEMAKELSLMAMKMKKPIRDQRKAVTKEKAKEINKTIDAMDVMLGLASYKK